MIQAGQRAERRTLIVLSTLQLLRNPPELIQRGLEIVRYVLCQDVWLRKVFGLLQALILQPDDVEVHLSRLANSS